MLFFAGLGHLVLVAATIWCRPAPSQRASCTCLYLTHPAGSPRSSGATHPAVHIPRRCQPGSSRRGGGGLSANGAPPRHLPLAFPLEDGCSDPLLSPCFWLPSPLLV